VTWVAYLADTWCGMMMMMTSLHRGPRPGTYADVHPINKQNTQPEFPTCSPSPLHIGRYLRRHRRT
jgi:hypothetical protein